MKALTASDKVADSFVGLGRDVNQHGPIVLEVAGDLDGITSVGLAVFTRPTGDQ